MAIQELNNEEVEIVAGAFSWGGAAFCGCMGLAAGGPAGGLLGFIGGGLLCP